MISIHCVLLAVLAFAWKVYGTLTTIGNPDVVFAFMATETVLIVLTVRLASTLEAHN